MKFISCFFAGVILAMLLVAVFYDYFQASALNVSANTFSYSVVRVNDVDCLQLSGTRMNVLGAHQYVAYKVTKDKLEVSMFVTRLIFGEKKGFQSDWPLLIPESKFLSEKVQVVCFHAGIEELIVTVVKTDHGLQVESPADL